MIYLFRDIDRSLALALYAGSFPKAPFTLVRNKVPEFTFEMLIEKKTNLKIIGFANVLGHLAGHSVYSPQSDFVNWLVNHLDVHLRSS